jgi:TPR repeat protein
MAMAVLALAACAEMKHGTGANKKPSGSEMYLQAQELLKDGATAQQAVVLLRRAAALGNADALYQLGVEHCIGGWEGLGVKRDRSEGTEYILKAAELGHPGAQRDIAISYEKGDGVPKDPEKAIYWYRKAAAQPTKTYTADVDINLGVLLMQYGKSKSDYEEAVRLFRRAHENGDALATYNLALAYNIGRGVERDLQQADVYLRQSAEKGCADAKDLLARLEAQKNRVPQEQKPAPVTGMDANGITPTGK